MKKPYQYFLLVITCILLIGCIPQQQYRKYGNGGYFVTAGQKCTEATEAQFCETAEENKAPPYFMGIVEFDDSGLLYDIRQLNFVIKQIQDRGTHFPNHAGSIVIAFAHGWTHNASPDDESLKFFRDLLNRVARYEEDSARALGSTPRLVEGVYLAWHAHSMIVGFEQVFTFFPRKATAHRIGEREATQALLRLRDTVYGAKANQQDPNNRFIIVGHSFGGALVYSAISQLLSSQLLCQVKSPEKEPNRLADSVILINPALEAVRVLPLIQTVSHNETCASNQKRPSPQLAIFTSDSDHATKMAFTWAGFTSTIYKKIFGISYRDGVPNPLRSRPNVGEQDADSRSIGHFDPLVTHFLVPLKRPKPSMAKDAGCQKASGSGVARRLLDAYNQGIDHLDFGDTCLVVADPKYGKYVRGFEDKISPLKHRHLAIFNVKVDPEIWDGHGLEPLDRKEMFLNFLGRFIPFSLGKETF